MGAVYHGHDEMRRYPGDIGYAWRREFRLEPEAYFDLGEQTLAFSVAQRRGRSSGADVAMSYAQVMNWRGALAVYFKGYAHKEDALGDLGVSEHTLEPIAL